MRACGVLRFRRNNGSAVSGEAQHNSVVSSNPGDDVVL